MILNPALICGSEYWILTKDKRIIFINGHLRQEDVKNNCERVSGWKIIEVTVFYNNLKESPP